MYQQVKNMVSERIKASHGSVQGKTEVKQGTVADRVVFRREQRSGDSGDGSVVCDCIVVVEDKRGIETAQVDENDRANQ